MVQVLTAAGVTVDAGDASWIVSRTGMAHAALPDGRKVVLLGTMRRNIGGYPYLIALNAASGATVWVSKLDDHPAALLTMAPAVTEDSAFMGVSSLEESRAGAMQYPCCSFRGSFVRVGSDGGAGGAGLGARKDSAPACTRLRLPSAGAGFLQGPRGVGLAPRSNVPPRPQNPG